MYDSVIVGGGVAGLTAAYLLSKEGFKVLVVERKSEDRVGDKICGDAIGRHHFINLGFEEPKVGLDAEGFFKGVNVVSPDEKHIIPVYGDGYALNRGRFGAKLFRMAINSGAEVLLEHSFIKPIVSYSRVEGVYARFGGYIKDFHAKTVIDASGALAHVRRSLPREWWVSEPVPDGDFNICYREIWIGGLDIDHSLAWIFLNVNIAPGGYWWLFPKREGLYNVGLGIQKGLEGLNPKAQFNKYVRGRFKIDRIVHGGGGIVPTRRPIPCMVWNGFITIGDAASTANPLHGGGIGPAMLSAKIAVGKIVEALSSGEASMERLWSYHNEYHKAYGAKQASLDVLRMYLQKIGNNDLNYIFKSVLVNGGEINEIGSKGEIGQTVISKLKTALKLTVKPSLLAEIIKVKQYMDKAKKLYLNYPETPLKYPEWRENERKLIGEYRKWVNSITRA
jgi:geranylgeranyl reductase family protein